VCDKLGFERFIVSRLTNKRTDQSLERFVQIWHWDESVFLTVHMANSTCRGVQTLNILRADLQIEMSEDKKGKRWIVVLLTLPPSLPLHYLL
jgi:hypothetical protein